MTDRDFEDLRTSVYATARGRSQRRVMVAGIVAVAVVGAGAVGTATYLAGGPDVTPGPDDVRNSAEPSAGPTPSTLSPAALDVPGTFVYLRAAAGKPIEVTTVRGFRLSTVSFGTMRAEDYAVVVSPDLTKVALVSSPDIGALAPGDLTVVEPGGKRRGLAAGVVAGGGAWPTWSPDSTSLIVSVGSGRRHVDVASGRVTPFAGPLNYLTYSANGAFMAQGLSSEIVVSRADGTEERRVPLAGLPECTQTPQCPYGVQAVSDDGRLVATGHGNSDPGHTSHAHIVMDAVTGKRVTLPVQVVSDVFFRPGGVMVVRGKAREGDPMTLYLLGPDRKVVATMPEPPNMAGQNLVAYRP